MLQVVWAITFIGVIILGIIAGRKVKNIQEWALGGRNLTWIDVGCILAAFQMGGTTIIGVAQNGFKIGYAGAWYSITGHYRYAVYVAGRKAPAQENQWRLPDVFYV